jgi:SlyX protein
MRDLHWHSVSSAENGERKIMSMEERMMDMEVRIARQEDLIDVLNQTVFRQQNKIDELETLCTALAKRLREVADNLTEEAPLDERPPHY